MTMNRATFAAACCSLALPAMAGCSATTGKIPVEAMMANVSSVARAPGAESTDGLPPGRVKSLLLSDEDVSNIVGLPMHGTGTWHRPGADVTLRDRNDCNVLTMSGRDFWTADFTSYQQVAQQDSDDRDFFVWQGAAAYPNGRNATQVFQRSVGAGLQARCRAAVLPAEDDENTVWRVDSLTTSNSRLAVLLSEQRGGQLTGWRCATQIRVQRNVIHRDGACQTGNPSTTTQQIADITADRIGG